MSGKVDYRSIALLTEHLGYPPLDLIDDVINAVNEIMYSGTKEIERYLTERQQKHVEDLKRSEGFDEDAKIQVENLTFTTEEIAIGTGKLESLLETQIDRNFDKFELYTLRNILVFPKDLTDGGWIRLKHHEGIEFDSNAEEKRKELEGKLTQLISNLKNELNLRKILKLQIAKAEKVVKTLRLFKESLGCFGFNNEQSLLSEDAKAAFKLLSPINETLYFLFNQVSELIMQTEKILQLLHTNVDKGGIKDIKFQPSLRDKYTDGLSFKILHQMGIISNIQNSVTIGKEIESTALEDVESIQAINESVKPN